MKLIVIPADIKPKIVGGQYVFDAPDGTKVITNDQLASRQRYYLRLSPPIAPARTPADMLPGFRGDLSWIHAREGHAGAPYWPGGPYSGLTLDPGFDLGYQTETDLRRQYHFLSSAQLDALAVWLGRTGPAASAGPFDPKVKGIRISYSQADQIMPQVAAPYWRDIVKRFSVLDDPGTPPQVQTALLSLAFNRGAHNWNLHVLKTPLAGRDWETVGELIRSMQQGHRLIGIRKRRQLEGSLILGALA